jgi:hypothetical protein
MRLREYNTKGAINNWASSWSEMKRKTLKSVWNKLISNEEPEFDLEGTEENFHGASGSDPSDASDWCNRDEEDFGYQNLAKEETARQTEQNSLSEKG